MRAAERNRERERESERERDRDILKEKRTGGEKKKE